MKDIEKKMVLGFCAIGYGLLVGYICIVTPHDYREIVSSASVLLGFVFGSWLFQNLNF
jgi:hypothetical protein